MDQPIVAFLRGFTEPAAGSAYRHRQDRRARKQAERATGSVEDLAERPDALLRAEIEEIGRPWTGWVFVWDPETTMDPSQRMRYGFYQLHGLKTEERIRLHRAGQLTRQHLDRLAQEGIFYDPTRCTADEIETIRRYAREHHIKCLTRDVFVDLLYRQILRIGALIVGLNQPFDFGSLATSYTRGGKDYRTGFSLKLCTCTPAGKDGKPRRHCLRHPSVRIKAIGRHKAFIKLQATRAHAAATAQDGHAGRSISRAKMEGHFLDCAALAGALLGGSVNHSLEALGAILGVSENERKLPSPDFRGPITFETLDYARRDVLATWAVYQKLRDLYRQHGLSARIDKLYSEASIGKAYLREMGIEPLLQRHPEFPRDILGHAMTALYGARVEMAYRLDPIEVEYGDFKSQYPTDNALFGNQDLLLAKDLTVEHGPVVMQRAQDILATVHQGITVLQSPAFWRKLRIFCEVTPDHDRLPLRTDYGTITGARKQSKNVAMPLIEHGPPTWYALPDLIASVLLTGKVPEVLDAFEVIPSAKQIETRPIAVMGDPHFMVDPATQDIFCRFIDLRTEVKRQKKEAKDTGNAAEAARLSGIDQGLKLCANATSYGIYVEIDEDDSYESDQPVAVHALTSRIVHVKDVEIPGSFCFPPIGALVTSGGHLLLALAEVLAKREGLGYGHMDTDGITLTRPETMPQEDFYAACERVRSWFTTLSPYLGQPPILEQEDENRWQDHREPLLFLGVSSKRYCLYNRVPDSNGPIERGGQRYDIRLRSFKAHGTGTYAHLADYQSRPDIPEPCEPVSQLGGPRWLYDLWYDFAVATERHYSGQQRLPTNADGAPNYFLPASPALDVPAFHQITLSTWHLLHQYAADYGGPLPGVRPFSFFSVVPGFVGGGDFRVPASKAARVFELMIRYQGTIPEAIAAAYNQVPTNTPFIGPKVNTPEEFHAAVERGEFGWWKDGQWHVLPSEVETPTIAEVFGDYFQHPEAKRTRPRGVGELSVPIVRNIDRQEIIGKEVDRLASGIFAGATEAAVPHTEVVQWLPYGNDADWRTILGSLRLRDLMVATGLPRQTLKDLRSGQTVTPEESTVVALQKGLTILSPDNPDNILGWADDIPYPYLASAMGWDTADIREVSCGRRQLTPEECELLLAAIREWKRSLESDNDEQSDSEKAARQYVTALQESGVAS